MSPAPLTDILFRRACAHFATGVAIASILDEEGIPHGLTINSFTSVSLSPPLVLICIDYRAASYPRFARATHYSISILSEEQQELSTRFAVQPDDRFDGVAWSPGLTGVPLIDGAITIFECATRQVIDGGDHGILLAEVVAVASPGGAPLVYFGSAYQRLDR